MKTSVSHLADGRLSLRVAVLKELFHFISFDDWVNSAQMRYRNHGYDARSALAVDQHGLICTRGKQFREAVYPVRVYAVDEPSFSPCGMLGPKVPTSEDAA